MPKASGQNAQQPQTQVKKIELTPTGIYKVLDDGARVLIIDTGVKFLAFTKEKDKVLTQVGNKKKVLTMKEISSSKAFIETIRPAIYLGSSRDFEFVIQALVRQLEEQNPVPLFVDLTGQVGRVKDENADFWILYDQIVWVEDKKIKSQDYNLIVDIRLNNVVYWIDRTHVADELVPHRVKRTIDEVGVQSLTIEYLLLLWKRHYGCEVISWAVLGYFVAAMFMPEIIKAREGAHFFPLLVLTGSTRSGKTSLLQNYYRFWGLPDMKGDDYTLTSAFVEIKQLLQFSCIPLWRDELRNIGHAQAKESLLRSLYSRSSISKGTASQELKSYKVKGTLLLSGEDCPRDPAIRRRLVLFSLLQRHKLPEWDWKEREQDSELFNELFWRFLIHGFDERVFRRLLATGPLYTNNAQAEERVLYAALGAVTSEELGNMFRAAANKYWQELQESGEEENPDENLSGPEAFLEFFLGQIYVKGWFLAKEFGSIRSLPEILRFAWTKSDGTLVLNTNLFSMAYEMGFAKMTTLGPTMLRRAFVELFEAKKGRARLARVVCRTLEIAPALVKKSSRLRLLCQNISECMERERNARPTYEGNWEATFEDASLLDPENQPVLEERVTERDIEGMERFKKGFESLEDKMQKK